MPLAASSVTALRRQLLAVQHRAIVSLIRGDALDPGMISLIGSVAAALAAIDQIRLDVEPAERAVVSDDSRAIRLTLFRGDEPAAAAELDAVRAIGLAAELIEAARWRLAQQ